MQKGLIQKGPIQRGLVQKGWNSGNPHFRNSGYPEIRTSGNPGFRKSGIPDFRMSGLRISRYPEFRKSRNPEWLFLFRQGVVSALSGLRNMRSCCYPEESLVFACAPATDSATALYAVCSCLHPGNRFSNCAVCVEAPVLTSRQCNVWKSWFQHTMQPCNLLSGLKSSCVLYSCSMDA